MHRYKKLISQRRLAIVSLIGLLMQMVMPFSIGTVSATAGYLSNVMVRFDRMATSTATTGTVCAQPGTAATEADVQVVFPTGYTLGAAGTFTVNTTNLAWPAGAAAWTGIGTATDVTTQTVTFPSGDLASTSTIYCFNWINTAAVTVKSSATASNTGTVTTRASGPTNIDTASYATASLADDTVQVTATVPSIFSMAINVTGAGADALGVLSSSSPVQSPTPRTITIGTNATSGFKLWAKDSNGGLRSTTASKTLTASAGTLSNGVEGFNTGFVDSGHTAGSGSISFGTNFQHTGNYVGGALGSSALSSVVTSSGTEDTRVITMYNSASISTITPAASDYATTITLVGAGLF